MSADMLGQFSIALEKLGWDKDDKLSVEIGGVSVTGTATNPNANPMAIQAVTSRMLEGLPEPVKKNFVMPRNAVEAEAGIARAQKLIEYYGLKSKSQSKKFGDLMQIPGAKEGTLGQQNLLTEEWDIKVKPDSPAAVVNVGEKEAAKYSFNKLAEADAQAGIAQNTLNNIKYIDTALKDIETGRLTELKVSLGELGKSFGLPVPEDIGSLEAANSAMGDLVMGILGKFKGAISNAEREFAATIVPKLTQTKEGRKEISKYMTKMANRAIEYNSQMAKYMSENDSNLVPSGKESFIHQWNKYIEKNPLFDDGKGTELDGFKIIGRR